MTFEFCTDWQQFIFGVAWSNDDDEVYPNTIVLCFGVFMLHIWWGDE